MTLVLSQVMAKRSKPRPDSPIGTAHLTYRDLARPIPPVGGASGDAHEFTDTGKCSLGVAPRSYRCAKARYNEPSATSLQRHVSDMTAAKVSA